MINSTPMVSIRNLSKHFGNVCALNSVNLDVDSGEIVFIVGDNGAGKSTLANILSGAVMPDQGSKILICGKPANIKKPKDAKQLRIATVYQDLALCNNLDAYINIFLGCELMSYGRLCMPAMKKECNDLFETIGSNIPNPEAVVSTRSGGQRQAIAIAKSMLRRPDVMVMDEATAALGVIQRKQVSKITRRLKNEGCAVIIISQDLQEAVRSADKVYVLRLGEVAAVLKGEEITRKNMTAYITGCDGGRHKS